MAGLQRLAKKIACFTVRSRSGDAVLLFMQAETAMPDDSQHNEPHYLHGTAANMSAKNHSRRRAKLSGARLAGPANDKIERGHHQQNQWQLHRQAGDYRDG